MLTLNVMLVPPLAAIVCTSSSSNLATLMKDLAFKVTAVVYVQSQLAEWR